MKKENSIFYQKKTINCGGYLLNIEKPIVMGILNTTPDSFYDGGLYKTDKEVLDKVNLMIKEGAAIIDIGAQSTRPKADFISVEEELLRLIPVLKLIRKEHPLMPISIDTFHSKVAVEAIIEGASIINDISGGMMDDMMFETIAEYKVPYILMHIQGTPKTMQDNPTYENVVIEIMDYFVHKLHALKRLGVNDIIIDLGFGFGKNVEHNYELLKKLSLFKMLDCPILCGFSRKSMINKVLNTKPAEALNGSTVLNTIALLNGAEIIRTHDVKEAMEAIKIVDYIQNI
jgi:dihydropteroate synthase